MSADRTSPFYREEYWRFDVVVDGYPAPACVEACEEEGWADCVVLDDAGCIVPNDDRTASRIERRRGIVTIRRTV